MNENDLAFGIIVIYYTLGMLLLAWLGTHALEWLSQKSERLHERRLRRMPGRIASIQPGSKLRAG
jgi:hypothetical protein